MESSGVQASTIDAQTSSDYPKCMARSPGARYDSARSLSDALRAYARPAVESSGLSESAFVYQAATDPEVLEEKVAGPVADAAVRSRDQPQRSAPARALAELGRALAYQPAHPDALALQKKFARHPRNWANGASRPAVSGLPPQLTLARHPTPNSTYRRPRPQPTM